MTEPWAAVLRDATLAFAWRGQPPRPDFEAEREYVNTLTFNFSGRTVIITGAAHGIGAELVTFFRAASADVVAVDLDAERLSSVADQTGAISVIGDVSTTETARSVIANALAVAGRIDVLVNNAGILQDDNVLVAYRWPRTGT